MKFLVKLNSKSGEQTVTVLVDAKNCEEAREKAHAKINDAMKNPDDWEVGNCDEEGRAHG